MLTRRTGLKLQLRHIVEKNPPSALPKSLPFTTDINAAIDDPTVQIVIELFGGTGIALSSVERALSKGKAVVTANKALLAEHGPKLFDLARKNNTCIAFEASCGGGIPIIDALQRGLIANRHNALAGIVNGTCNFILTRMSRNGWGYQQALTEAQKLGFAEANPSMDVSGRDSAQKLSILASLAFDAKVTEKDIQVDGIERVDAVDITFAKELGYVIKLLAVAQRANGGDALALHAGPSLVHEDDVLADVSDSFNAISTYSHALGHAVFYGRGAGQMPTASAVVGDVISVAMGVEGLRFKQLRLTPDCTQPVKTLPIEELRSRYYLRIMVKDEPGVIAQIATILGDQQISVSSIHQRETEPKAADAVPLVITTHKAKEGSIRAALKQIDALPVVKPASVCMRIVDAPAE